jgi:hypothetical protein
MELQALAGQKIPGHRAPRAGFSASNISDEQQHTVEFRTIEGELFVVVDGIKIAKRGEPGSAYAGRWVALEPGWSIIEFEGGNRLQISYDGARIH